VISASCRTTHATMAYAVVTRKIGLRFSRSIKDPVSFEITFASSVRGY
jgi:hypothetical protein